MTVAALQYIFTKPMRFTPLQASAGAPITVDSTVQLLFGIEPDAASAALTESYVASAPNATPDFVQVFESARYQRPPSISFTRPPMNWWRGLLG